VFPFIYNSVTYHHCLYKQSNGKTWCYTEVDSNGVGVAGKWGYCNSNCPDDKEEVVCVERESKDEDENKPSNHPDYIYDDSEELEYEDCYNGKAIGDEQVCDGVKDCKCGEDEDEWCYE